MLTVVIQAKGKPAIVLHVSEGAALYPEINRQYNAALALLPEAAEPCINPRASAAGWIVAFCPHCEARKLSA